MVMRFASVGALALLLAGCATDPMRIAAQDDASCRNEGHRPGTAAFASCRKAIDDQRATRRVLNSIPITGFGPRSIRL